MRVVVKVGTQTLSAGGDCLNRPRMIDLVRQIARLHAEGNELLLVSSGAIFAGREALGTLPKRRDIPFKQTLAAVGQVRLMAIYEQIFGLYDTHIAQALLTRADLADRERYLNARNTMLSLLRLGVVPVINENDVVGVEEIPFGSRVFDIAAGDGSGSGRTADEVEAMLADAGTVIYNGTVGLYEVDQFATGTDWIVGAIAACDARVKLVVGGDGVAAVNRRMGGIQEAQKKFTLCTGGGAALKYLATQNLTALDGLDERQ